MRNYTADMNKCRELEGKHVSFSVFAADALPWYIERCITLEDGVGKIKRQAEGLLN